MDVSAPDSLVVWGSERAEVPTALEANRHRREQAARETAAAREELAALLARGTRVGFTTAELARAAGISRETAHKLLREAGVPTLSQQHRRAEDAGIPSGNPRVEWFREQGWR